MRKHGPKKVSRNTNTLSKYTDVIHIGQGKVTTYHKKTYLRVYIPVKTDVTGRFLGRQRGILGRGFIPGKYQTEDEKKS